MELPSNALFLSLCQTLGVISRTRLRIGAKPSKIMIKAHMEEEKTLPSKTFA